MIESYLTKWCITDFLVACRVICLYFQIRPGCVSQLKTIRQLAISRLSDIFEAMPEYDFKPVCDAIFSAAVWPQVSGLL